MKKSPLLAFFAVAASFAASGQDKTIQLMAPELGADQPLRIACEMRKTYRDFIAGDVREEHLSTLLWMACGENRPDVHKRTTPTARNAQEIELYVFLKNGVYYYRPEKHILSLVLTGDHRKEVSQQEFFAKAPVVVVLVANFDKMKDFDTASRDFYSAVDCGYVSQDIYLFCASSDLYGTVACGSINRDQITKLLKLENAKPMLAHPVGRVQR